MDNVGAEVGQKMRSAIKAKLQELGCYVDDELPDYIMVMVANKRTESQMKEDLRLFLTNKTAAFVDWLQIVLKKLKEVTVTNPEVYKKVAKKRSVERSSDVKVKKEKKEKKENLKVSKRGETVEQELQPKSLTDDLPVEASKLTKKRKIVIEDKTTSLDPVNENVFDIPPLSAVATSNESELLEIENKIASVRSRLGLQVPSESEDEDFLTLKDESEELFPEQANHSYENSIKGSRKINIIEETNSKLENYEAKETTNISLTQTDKAKHARIVFENNITKESPQKRSIYERLGKRSFDAKEDGENRNFAQKKTKTKKDDENGDKLLSSWISKSVNKENDKEQSINKNGNTINQKKQRESALKRLGVKSKVSIPEVPPQPQINHEEESDIVINKDVPSAIKIKPRIIPPSSVQPNKNLLLKAVAEAQRSIAQTPMVGTNLNPKPSQSERVNKKTNKNRKAIPGKLPEAAKDKLRNILIQMEDKGGNSIDEEELKYVPKPLKQKLVENKEHEYVPTYKDTNSGDTLSNNSNHKKTTLHHRFVITLDGINKNKCKEIKTLRSPDISAKTEMDDIQYMNRKNSPIIFSEKKSEIPQTLPVVHQPTILKVKERCKYWPACNKGEKCEYLHPSTLCKNFPHCKFGDKCLYIHPPCKFESSCTKKDCPFSHLPKSYLSGPFLPSQLQQCKFFPNCSNAHCIFYHPRSCRFGKFCKNKSECNFLHTSVPPKQNLTWRN